MYVKLLLSFSYIGAFTFGGGYSMLPMFQRELVEKNKWLTLEELADLFSISQCLPGIIAANTAVFTGYKHKGIPGGIVSAFGVCLPSIIFILIIASFFTAFADIPMVQSAFTGLRVCVSVLIINAVMKLRKNSIVDLPSALIFTVIFLLMVFKILPVAVLVTLAGLFGIAISLLRNRSTPKGDAE
ncbi:MAG: chromate transporter [Oscillospiraceae bacterium]|nr:chromate transporter [Oscillospiraceae bacterium]